MPSAHESSPVEEYFPVVSQDVLDCLVPFATESVPTAMSDSLFAVAREPCAIELLSFAFDVEPTAIAFSSKAFDAVPIAIVLT